MDPDREPLDGGTEAPPRTANGRAAASRPSTEAQTTVSSGAAPAAAEAATEPPPSTESMPIDAPGDALAADPADTLSPAVRRLVRQYDLDITGIHGTGPAGKIRVGDVIGMLGGRAEGGPRTSDAMRGDLGDEAPTRTAADAPRGGETAAAAAARAAATTTVFECDLSRVLSHRKRERRNEPELLLTSYFLAAAAEALRTVPEIAPPKLTGAPLFGVLLGAADGSLRRTLVKTAEELGERLPAFDRQLRASDDDDLAAAQVLVHHYGPSGSLLATPTELGAGHAASIGIGRVRRQIVVKNADGEETPRVAALCHVTLTFLPERVALARANLFVAMLVRVLEQWPAEPTAA
jgi:2-oxoglutarate dehydrogenase E2 component (dihydrolipoamide succinyltransferase)